MNDTINRVEFWRFVSDRHARIDNEITECIDGRVLDATIIDVSDLDNKEVDAIRKGFMPDGYYSATDKMLKMAA